MLAPAPGDVARANAAQANVPGRQDVHPIQPGATGQCAQLRQQRTRAACSAQISRRRAAGMRCAAGQVTERRADCAADSAHNWSTRSAPMVDLSARTQVGAQSQQVPDFPAFTQRPAHHGVDVVRIEPWPPPAVPFGIAVRPGAPQGQRAVPATPSRIDRVAAEVAQNWFGTPQPDRGGGPPPNCIIVIRRPRPADRGCRRWRPGRHR